MINHAQAYITQTQASASRFCSYYKLGRDQMPELLAVSPAEHAILAIDIEREHNIVSPCSFGLMERVG